MPDGDSNAAEELSPIVYDEQWVNVRQIFDVTLEKNPSE